MEDIWEKSLVIESGFSTFICSGILNGNVTVHMQLNWPQVQNDENPDYGYNLLLY